MYSEFLILFLGFDACKDWRGQGLLYIGKCGIKETISEEKGKRPGQVECLFLSRIVLNLIHTLHCFQITKVTETNLSANQERGEMEKKRLVWKVEGSDEESKVVRGGPIDPSKLVVELGPMEIRTFLIDFANIRVYGS